MKSLKNKLRGFVWENCETSIRISVEPHITFRVSASKFVLHFATIDVASNLMDAIADESRKNLDSDLSV